MEQMGGILFSACSIFLLVELIYFLAPEESAMKWVCGLIYTLVIAGAVIQAAGVDFGGGVEFLTLPEQEPRYLSETQKSLNGRIRETLEAAGVACSGVDSLLEINDELEVSVDRIRVGVRYSSDRVRAEAVLERLFRDLPGVEVYVDEGR